MPVSTSHRFQSRLRRGLITTTALATLGVAVAGSAYAVPVDPIAPDLPKAGEEMTFPVSSKGFRLEIANDRYEFEKLQGELTMKVGRPSADGSTPTEVTDFTLKGRTEASEDATITIEKSDDSRANAPSFLKPAVDGSSKYEHALSFDFTTTVETAQGLDRPSQRTEREIVLYNDTPVQLKAGLEQFPPSGDVYKLENPIDLVSANDPGSVISLRKFPIQVGAVS